MKTPTFNILLPKNPKQMATKLTRRVEKGFSLIELLIATAISLLILLAVSALFINSSRSERTNGAASEITTNGRYAIEVLRRDLLHAGYRGITSIPNSYLTTSLGNATGDCAAGFYTNTATNPIGGNIYVLEGVFGLNDSNPYSATCIPAANYSTGDILVTRHAAQSPKAAATNVVSLRSTYGKWELFKGATGPAAFIKTPQFDYPLETAVYFISPFSETSGDGLPALYKVSLSAGPAMTSSLVASNIENMQVQYEFSDKNSATITTRFYNANDLSKTVTPSQWDSVTAVRLWLLVRANNTEPGYTNTSSYIMGDKTITVSDGFRRELFSTVVQVRNP